MPASIAESSSETTYPLRVVARLTGISPELLRAWERRYGVVTPVRTAGGTRRYSAADLEHLRLLKQAVDAGHRIGRIAHLGLDELRRRAAPTDAGLGAPSAPRLDEILSALARLEAAEVQRLLSLQLSALGPVRFSRELALPLVREIGARWATERLGIASEHLASGMLRSMLGSAMQHTAASQSGPRIVFATPTGERHELGLQMAALTALGAGADPIYLGAELPVEDLLVAVETTDARALALGVVTIPPASASRTVAALRGGLPDAVHLWLGGAGARGVQPMAGVEHFDDLGTLEQSIRMLLLTGSRRR